MERSRFELKPQDNGVMCGGTPFTTLLGIERTAVGTKWEGRSGSCETTMQSSTQKLWLGGETSENVGNPVPESQRRSFDLVTTVEFFFSVEIQVCIRIQYLVYRPCVLQQKLPVTKKRACVAMHLTGFRIWGGRRQPP